MKIKVVKLHGYKNEDRLKLKDTLTSFQLCINSTDFKDLILGHEVFDSDNNLSNNDVYNIIMSGREVGTNVDYEADLDLSIDERQSTNTIGYNTGKKIFTFRNMFENLPVSTLSGHFAHEYCHTLGFRDPSDLSNRQNNVPYEVGRIIQELSEASSLDIRLED